MSKYLNQTAVQTLCEASHEIVAIRNRVVQQTGIDILDTDAISSACMYEIVSQYDSNYNVNWARNGEDACSDSVLIEQKAAKVPGPLTKTGRQRKGAGSDAAWQFHAHGTLEYPRYILAARHKDTLQILRIYDIQTVENRQAILTHLLRERDLYDQRCLADVTKKKRDPIFLTEKFIQRYCKFVQSMDIQGCVIRKDT